MLCIFAQLLDELCGRCNACQQDDVCFRCDVAERLLTAHIDGLQTVVSERCEIEFLVWIQVESLCEDKEVDGKQAVRALGDDDDVGSVLTALWLAQPSCRQEFVVDDESVVVDEQDVDTRLDVSVLIGIVEDDGLRVFRQFVGCQSLDALTPVGIDSYVDMWKLPLDLTGFVADVDGCRLFGGQYEASALTLIASAQYGHLHLVAQQPHEIFHMGCFPRAAHGDVAHRDDGCVEGTAFQDAHFKEMVSQPYHESVAPA